MDPSPPYSLLEDRKTKPFAEVAEPLWDNPTLREVLASFRKFLSIQEIARLLKDQLGLFRALSVLVIETSAKSVSDGEDVSGVLAASVNVLNTVSSHLQTTGGLDNVIENPNQLSDMESNIREGFEGLETQLRKLPQATEFEVIVYNDEFIKARQRDRTKIEELAAIVKQMTPQSGGSFDTIVESLMEERLMIIRDSTLGQEQTSAKRALALLVELTGKSLPPPTILGKEFITIGHQAIHQGASYDIFVGECFTGEKIAVKQLRHRVDEETAKKTHERSARQVLNWSTLRHDAILSFYGMGVAPSPFFPGDFQLYTVSPYLQNRDARRYLKVYPRTSGKVRLQMTFDVARGLFHMHEATGLPEPTNGIFHSALNIFNVLIKDSGRAVISGIGHSKVIRDLQGSFTGDGVEYRYMAPEMITDEPHITYGTDIWSWAMTTLEILTDVPAFGEKLKGPKIIQTIALGKQPNRADHPKLEEYACADDLWSLFEECWAQDAVVRPKADQLIQRLKPMVHTLGRTTRGEEQVQVSQEPPRKRPSIPKIARQDRLVTGVSRSLTVPTAPSAEQGDLDRAVPPLERAFWGIRNVSVESPESSSQGLAQLAQLAGAALATIATVISPGSPQSDPGKPEPDNTPEPDLVSGSMSITKIMEHLIKHGCKDVTDDLNLLKCSEYPVAGGGFGDVYRGRLQDGSTVAIKCSRLFIENIQDMDDSRRKIAKAEAHEMYVASRLRHENIVGVMGVAHFKNQVAMISPWMENGKIIAYLNKNPEADRCAACTQVSKGLAYMHQNGIVHGDLKGENVLVSHDGIAQITDFGNTILAQYTLQFTASQSKKPAISARWAALELVLGDEGVNTTASDVWALGMTILEIITGEVPFHDKILERQVYSAIMQKKLPSRPQNQIPSDSNNGDRLWELITRCWTEEPAKRPNTVEVGEILEKISRAGLEKK